MKKEIKNIFNAIAVAYIPCLLILSFFPKNNDGFVTIPYALNLLFFFLYSFPFYCTFLEIGFAVERARDSVERTMAEKIINTIRIILALTIPFTLINLDDLLFWALALAVALVAFWILGAVMFRKGRQKDESFNKKTLLISVAAVVIIVCGIAAIIRGVADSKNKVELSGGGLSTITGSIAYFYDEGEYAIDVFYSKSDAAKEITLSRGKTYNIGFRPSFNGSKDAIYTGDCAKFIYDDGACVISYVGDWEHQPIYDMTVTAQDDFKLTIDVDGYVQTITIYVT